MKKVLTYILGTVAFCGYIVVMIFLLDRADRIEQQARQPEPIQVLLIEERL